MEVGRPTRLVSLENRQPPEGYGVDIDGVELLMVVFSLCNSGGRYQIGGRRSTQASVCCCPGCTHKDHVDFGQRRYLIQSTKRVVNDWPAAQGLDRTVYA